MHEDFGLGRFPSVDERDRNYPLRAILKEDEQLTADDEAALRRGWRYWWPGGWWGDQGRTPQCVAYSLLHQLEDGPLTKEPRKPGAGPIVPAQQVYDLAQRLDEWAGENYDGTSVRGGAKALRQLGFIREYRWAFTIDVLVRALLVEGPVVFGTYWYYDMFFPDASGLVSVSGEISGGHAYLLDGVNVNTGLIRFKNSWGRGWGKRGFGYMRIEDADTLLNRWGEACRLVE